MPSGPARPDIFPSSDNLCEEHRAGNRADRGAENGISDVVVRSDEAIPSNKEIASLEKHPLAMTLDTKSGGSPCVES